MDEADYGSDEPDGPEKRPLSLPPQSTTALVDQRFVDSPNPALRPILLEDRPYFDQVFSRLKSPISDYAFPGTFIWGSSLRLYWARIDRHVCVFANGTGDLTMLLPPLPEPGASSADLRDCVGDCFEIMDRYNDRHAQRDRSRIEYVSDEVLEWFSAAPTLRLSAAPMSGDYVYDMDRII